MTDRAIGPSGNILSPVKPTRGAPIGCSRSSRIPICLKAGKYKMLAELPLSINTLCVLYPAIMIVTIRGSSCGCCSRAESSFEKVIRGSDF